MPINLEFLAVESVLRSINTKLSIVASRVGFGFENGNSIALELPKKGK
jgi:hypothetical protein